MIYIHYNSPLFRNNNYVCLYLLQNKLAALLALLARTTVSLYFGASATLFLCLAVRLVKTEPKTERVWKVWHGLCTWVGHTPASTCGAILSPTSCGAKYADLTKCKQSQNFPCQAKFGAHYQTKNSHAHTHTHIVCTYVNKCLRVNWFYNAESRVLDCILSSYSVRNGNFVVISTCQHVPSGGRRPNNHAYRTN